LNEGLAAAVADAESRHVADVDLRAGLNSIARDEQQHAELAWDVLRWALEVGGDDARTAARGFLSEASMTNGGGRLPPDLGCFGVLSGAAVARIEASVRQGARARLASTIAAS
jgi:hypothetical protein